MTRKLAWILVLLVVSAVPVVQQARLIRFVNRGNGEYEEDQGNVAHNGLIEFGGRRIRFADAFPARRVAGNGAEDRVQGLMSVWVDDSLVLQPMSMEIRPGAWELGRYVRSVNAHVFTERKTSAQTLFVGRRIATADFLRDRYELLRMDVRGAYAVDTISYSARARNYPVSRMVAVLSEWGDEPFSFTSWPLLFLVPSYFGPWAGLLVAAGLLARYAWVQRLQVA